jgi:hypothetical protein
VRSTDDRALKSEESESHEQKGETATHGWPPDQLRRPLRALATGFRCRELLPCGRTWPAHQRRRVTAPERAAVPRGRLFGGVMPSRPRRSRGRTALG